MTARRIDGKAAAAELRERVARSAAEFERQAGRPPGLATVLVGEDPASAIYVGGKQKACREVGINGIDRRLSADTSREELIAKLLYLMQHPIRGLAVVLNGTIRNIAVVLDQIRQQKDGGGDSVPAEANA